MTVLEEGYLLKNKKTEKETKKRYVTRVIGAEYLDRVLVLQDLIIKTNPIKETFSPDSREDLIQQIENDGLLIGTLVDEELIAYRYVSFPREHYSNLGVDLNIDREELNLVANLETTVVHPDYRGNRLQWKTLDRAIGLIERKGYIHLCTTISPKNPYSMSNIMDHDLVIRRIKRKYGIKIDQSDGLVRYILHRNLKFTPCNEYENEVEIDVENVSDQMALLEKGYVGYKLSNTTGKVTFAKENLCHVELVAK